MQTVQTIELKKLDTDFWDTMKMPKPDSCRILETGVIEPRPDPLN